SRIHVAVDERGGDVEEAACFDVGALPSGGPELEARSAAEKVSEHLAVAVVVPARGDAALRAHAEKHRPVGVERELTREARSGRARREALRGDGGDALSFGRRADAAHRSGGGGIRTHGAAFAAQRFSRPSHSSALAPRRGQFSVGGAPNSVRASGTATLPPSS